MTVSIPNRRVYTGASAISVAAMLLSAIFATTASAADKPVVPPSPATIQKVVTAEAPPTDQFIVKFKLSAVNDKAAREKTYDEATRDISIHVTEVKGIIAAANDVRVVKASRKLNATEVEQVQKSIAAVDNVSSVEPDILMQTAYTPNDTFYSKQGNLSDPNVGIRVPSVWDRTIGVGQVVAVIDSGVASHSDLNSNVIAGYDMVSPVTGARDSSGRKTGGSDPGDYKTAGSCGSSTPSNSTWHGTHVAGIISAVGNNGAGITGAAPGVKIVPIRAMGECGGYLSDVMDSITWASGGTVPGVQANANPAQTINLSIGSKGTCSSTFQAVIDAAVQRGSTIFVSAGNQNQPASNFAPANCNNVIVVGASNQSGDKASYSNYGSAVDIMAPGGDTGAGILSTYNTGTTTPGTESYGYMMGTSMAAPTAAAVGALMKSADPSLTPAQIEAKLKATAHALPGACAGGCGSGLIDASSAVVPPFNDLAGNLFVKEIAWMKKQGISTGYADGSYRPYATVTREQMAPFMYRMAGSPIYTPPTISPFVDVPTSHYFYKEIAWMRDSGVSTGWSDGTFRPSEPVLRESMAAFMQRYSAQVCSVDVSANKYFTDAKTSVFAPQISWMGGAGITTGYSDGTYRPFDTVTREAMAAFMYRLNTHINSNGGCK